MSDNNNNFGIGFLVGTIVGGVVGGIIGTVIANKGKDSMNNNLEGQPNYSAFDSEEEIENARLSLEEKINQLNHAIDDVRVTLSKNTETTID